MHGVENFVVGSAGESAYCAPVPVKEYTLTELSTSATAWMQRTEKGWRAVKAPRDHVRALLQRGARLNFPVLSGIITSPLMFADGRLLERRGYDEQSGLLFPKTSEEFPLVPLHPTEQELEASLELLTGLLSEFVFADPASKSVALSGLLTSCCRAALNAAPLHGATAPQAGTGKSYLQELWVSLLLGRSLLL